MEGAPAPRPPDAPLSGIRVLDLTRILAGPTATQLLGDLGADIIKVEHPLRGDDTRGWGPPYLEGKDGTIADLSAYFIAANRNKRSLAVDMADPRGQALVRRLISLSDVVIENFKTGNLRKYRLSYEDLKADHPRLIYCSITGYGQTGPYADRVGYDILAQAMGGLMSVTGEPHGEPMKVGVGIADIMCGMYAAVGILAALHVRRETGRGQYIDLALLDSQIAWLANVATNYFISQAKPQRFGNAHPNIVPYRLYRVADGHVVLAVGNDRQFRDWCELAQANDLCKRFPTNAERVRHRDELEPRIEQIMLGRTRADWDRELAKRNIPGGPVLTLSEVFKHPQVSHRGCRVKLGRPESEPVWMLGNPIKFSRTPVVYRRAPPALGEHTDEVLESLLGMTKEERAILRQQRVIA
jgi:crotonobetainyl-CoA:carnitine CoA-transferase CaiB-like acyl-CoA transferase